LVAAIAAPPQQAYLVSVRGFRLLESAMTRAAVLAAFLLSSLTLAAQSGSTAGAASSQAASHELRSTSGGTITVLPTVAGCPIGMQASQGVWDHTIRIREGDKERGLQPFGQKISLTLKDPRHARITAATVRVHGLTGKNRMLQTGSEAGTPDAVTTIRLSFGPQGDAGVTGDLWVPGFTAVTLIELQEVSYSDGSTWKVSGTDICHVQPDPLMLISNR
jgi:hypothetical protein